MAAWNLETLGWNRFFAERFEPYAQEGLAAARVAIQHKASYTLYAEQGELRGESSGKLMHMAQGPHDFPVVGDWVVIRPRSNESAATIERVLPRKTQFSRKAAGSKVDIQVVAANIDTVFLVCGLDHDFNLRRIERYLVLTYESGAKPVIILNKADLREDAESLAEKVEEVAIGVPVHLMSATQMQGQQAIEEHLHRGTTAALLGSSGAGKSTILNLLIGEDVQEVREVREKDARGRHTTTHRELFMLPNGAMMIDTPGMREIQIWDGFEGFKDTFDDIEELAQDCRFRNCKHESEPDCAVREAVEDGRLELKRLNNYRKLQREVLFQERKQDKNLDRIEKERWKKITTEYRKQHKKR